MKLVNPRLLNIQRDFRFSELIMDCSDFLDKYTNSDQKKNGCYGCEHLSTEYRQIQCDKKHRVIFGLIRKTEDNEFESYCHDFEKKRWDHDSGYVRSGCNKCAKLRSRRTGICESKHKIQEEVYRIG